MAITTTPGYVNGRGQVVLGPTGRPGTDYGQSIYVLSCERCAQVYGANGSDIHARRCPNCDGGAPGFDVSADDVLETPIPRARNPNWMRDELILALDLYFDHPGADQTHPEVRALSALLNQFWAQAGGATSATLRNPSGVSMKLSNFQRLDPTFQSRGNKGLANGAQRDVEIWDEFSGDRARLGAVARAIKSALAQSPGLVTLADDEGPEAEAEAAEGAVLTRLHHYRERDRGLVKKRKALALKRHGRLACEACDFEFGIAYGPRGDAYIEAHHTRPLETLDPSQPTKVSDLALLCANCHRMVHAKRPWLSLAELKALIADR